VHRRQLREVDADPAYHAEGIRSAMVAEFTGHRARLTITGITRNRPSAEGDSRT
jgi:hypothetical protein